MLVATYAGVISPVSAEYILQSIERAERERYSALVIELDTPGGLDLSMRAIVKSVMAARVPVIVYVYPPGGRAASAGVFVAMAAHVAAMAPGTNIGAAHPVMIGTMPSTDKDKGGMDKVMERKTVSDAAAYLKSLAQRRGRNEGWAFEAVSRSTSIPASEALSLGVVDLVADDLADLLAKADGRKLADFPDPLRTAGADTDRHEMTRRQRWLAALSDPNVAMILMSLGAAGLFIELYNPGLILPGIVGAVALILAFYSFHTLSASYAGVLLILAGLAFFLLEIKVTSFGMLALGGAVAVMLGALMLFQQQSLGGLGVSWGALLAFLGVTLGAVAALSYVVYLAHRRRATTGPEGMVGAQGRAFTALSPAGKVAVLGEIWDAEAAEGDLPEGAPVVVEAVEGLRLRVRRK